MHKSSANDATRGNDNAIAMPPYRSGEKFEDIYDVILILDDRENFGLVIFHNYILLNDFVL